jgi:Carboxypeptidase regulatory-like domain
MNFISKLILFIFCLHSPLFAQIKEVYITGNIKSTSNKSVIEKVNVAAIQNNIVIQNVLSGVDGNFTMTVPEGSYILKCTKVGFDSTLKSNITLKEGEQIILVMYMRDKININKIACKPAKENNLEVYDKSCLVNTKLIKDGLSPEEACQKSIRYPCIYQVRKIRFQIIIDETGTLVYSKQIEAIDNSNKHYTSSDTYPFWEDAGKEGKRILATILFDAPKLKSSGAAVKTSSILDVPISCK